MFSTFSVAGSTDDIGAARNESRARRCIEKNHACGECRRRKIKCDGRSPCGNCVWYKIHRQCSYPQKPTRPVPAQKTLRRLESSLKQSQRVLQQLFPETDLAQLGTLSRKDLIERVVSISSTTPPPEPVSPPIASDAHESGLDDSDSPDENDAPNLEALVQQRDPELGWDERHTSSDGNPPVPDDVNALSLTVSQRSSYAGISSIRTSLRVIQRISRQRGRPHLGLARPPWSTRLSRRDSPSSPASVQTNAAPSPSSRSEASLIKAYFSDVHPLIPMIDKVRFLSSWEAADRKDDSWIALSNMVLAMGSIAATSPEDKSHVYYYNLAKQYLTLDILGNGNIEVVQALSLMGGLYLHYTSRPNTANAIMGAVIRMACALGLHREFDPPPRPDDPDAAGAVFLPQHELRRRTWWSLFCLDTWGTTTMGRPSLGRIGSAVTIGLPLGLKSAIDPARLHSSSDDDLSVLILRHEVVFCRIATRVQDRLAELPIPSGEEIVAFDTELQEWYESLPDVLRTSPSCPTLAITPRAIMNWRFNNMRLLLHRPPLMDCALRSSLNLASTLADQQIQQAAECAVIVTKTISDIRRGWHRTQFSSWHAVWLLFQACMAAFVALFSAYNRHDYDEVNLAQTQIEDVIVLLESMSSHAVAAPKTLVFVKRVYNFFFAMAHEAEEAGHDAASQPNKTSIGAGYTPTQISSNARNERVYPGHGDWLEEQIGDSQLLGGVMDQHCLSTHDSDMTSQSARDLSADSIFYDMLDGMDFISGQPLQWTWEDELQGLGRHLMWNGNDFHGVALNSITDDVAFPNA